MDAAAIILSGGQNSRMGKNKAFLSVGDKPIIEHTIGELRPVVKEIIVVTNQPEQYGHLGVTVTTDIIPQKGPLSGMHAGLTVSRYQHNFIVACDMPFVDGRLVHELIDMAPGFDVVIPQMGDYLQPLYAVYSKNCLPPMEECLNNDIRKIIAFYHKVRLRYVGESVLGRWGNPERVFYNVNTPEDLAWAEKIKGNV